MTLTPGVTIRDPDASGEDVRIFTDAAGKLIQGVTQVDGDGNPAVEVAHDAVDAGNPTKIGGKASSSAPADVAAGDRVNTYHDLKGRIVVKRDESAPVAGDVAHDAVDSGNPIKVGGKASASAPADVADGDRVDAYHDLKGRQVVKIDAAVDVNLQAGDGTDLTHSSGVLNAGGNVAHDAADAGNPIKVGGKASASAPADVADGDRVDAYHDLKGRQVVKIDAAVDVNLQAGDGTDIQHNGGILKVEPSGNVAHDAADAGNPIKVGGKASTSTPVAVADADRVDAYFDEVGRQIVRVDDGIAHDAVDAGNPIKIGGKAASSAPAAVAAGDRVAAYFDLSGRLGVKVDQGVEISGDVAHDGADSGKPAKIGGKALGGTVATPVAADDRSNLMTDLSGRLLVAQQAPRELVVDGTATITGTSETTLIAAGAAGIFHDLSQLILSNSGDVDVTVSVRRATAGAVVFKVFVRAKGGAVMNFPIPIPQAAAANNWTLQASGSTTSLEAFGLAFKTK